MDTAGRNCKVKQKHGCQQCWTNCTRSSTRTLQGLPPPLSQHVSQYSRESVRSCAAVTQNGTSYRCGNNWNTQEKKRILLVSGNLKNEWTEMAFRHRLNLLYFPLLQGVFSFFNSCCVGKVLNAWRLSPADFLCSHVEQDVCWGNAKSHIINQHGAGVRDHGDALWSGNRNALLDPHQQIKTRTGLDHLTVCVSDLRLVLAEVWQGEGRLWINAVMVDVSLGGHKHQLTASAEQKEIWICGGHFYWTLSKGKYKDRNIEWRHESPFGSIHNTFNTSWENGVKCFSHLGFLFKKNIEAMMNNIFTQVCIWKFIHWYDNNYKFIKHTSICSCLESTNGPNLKEKKQTRIFKLTYRN